MTFHRDAEERDEVHDEDGPEHWNVEHVEECTHDSDGGGLGDRIPELEFRKSTNERPELFVAMRWECGTFRVIC